MRRCPRCPTEYLIEIKVVEDAEDRSADGRGTGRFKRAIVVTRWSDLGDGRVPWEGEWAACNEDEEKEKRTDGDGAGAGGVKEEKQEKQEEEEQEERYDSFSRIGNRAISGVFESHFTAEAIPPQRILSLNPKGIERGEDGHGWY